MRLNGLRGVGMTCRHRLVVRNYSKEAAITASNAQVAIVNGNDVIETVRLPRSPTSTQVYWDVLAVHGESGKVRTINKLRKAWPKRLRGLHTEPPQRAEDCFVATLVVVNAVSNELVPNAGAALTYEQTEAFPWPESSYSVRTADGHGTIEGAVRNWRDRDCVAVGSATGMISIPQTVRLPQPETTVRVVTVPTSADKELLRFVLTWGAVPANLDLHVFCPDGSDIYGAKPTSGTMPVVLEAQCDAGYGAESARLHQGVIRDWCVRWCSVRILLQRATPAPQLTVMCVCRYIFCTRVCNTQVPCRGAQRVQRSAAERQQRSGERDSGRQDHQDLPPQRPLVRARSASASRRSPSCDSLAECRGQWWWWRWWWC